MNGATLSLTIGSGTIVAGGTSVPVFVSGAAASHFSLAAPDVSGLSISGVTGITTGGRTATVTLAHSADGRTVPGAGVAVRVAAAAYNGSSTFTSPTVFLSSDYDQDDDGLIEIRTLQQLNAVRWDLDGNGTVAAGNQSNYNAAFGGAVSGMGCPATGCTGYELANDLDFDTDGDGDVDANDTGTYTNWVPIGGSYTATFEGNGHKIVRLRVTNPSSHAGLFHELGSGGTISGVGMIDARVSANSENKHTGTLAGRVWSGTIIGSYAEGGSASITTGGNGGNVGGLVGAVELGAVRASFSSAAVTLTNRSLGGSGGLVGDLDGTIIASYAAGSARSVTSHSVGRGRAGGMVGRTSTSDARIHISYSRAAVSASGNEPRVGGLVALRSGSSAATASYWDRQASGQTSSVLGVGDYDLDDDGLIEVYTLAQLNAIRWDRGAATTFRWRVVADADPATADADPGDHGGASGEATIPAGETSVEIEVRIADDEAIEPAREWFEVAIEAPANGCCTVRRARARVAVLEGVCDRTPAVADALRGAAACTAPTPAALASRTRLAVSGAGTLRAGDFQGLTGVQWLDLSANGLITLPEGAFAGAISLRELDLSGNALTSLPPQPFAALPGLRALDLSGNGFAALPEGLFAGLSLREASLADNPGAPFALAVELMRTDADRWADGPATVEARLPAGAPFPMRLPLSAEPAADGLPTMLDIPAGATAAEPFAATAPATGALTLRAGAATMPAPTCGAEWPFRACFRGLAPMPSQAITLFRQPPRALPAPEPEALVGDDLRLPLASLIAAGDGALRWEATSSDESVATARILGGNLLVEPELAAEGTAEIVLVATDSAGLTATVRFEVQVEFFAPTRPNAGWRSALRRLAPQ